MEDNNIHVDLKLMKRILKIAGTHKLCTKCNCVKTIEEFDKLSPTKNNYLRSDCKICRQTRNKNYHANKI